MESRLGVVAGGRWSVIGEWGSGVASPSPRERAGVRGDLRAVNARLG